MFQIFKIVKVMVGSGRDVQWCVLNCYLWLPETESFPFSGWTALRVAFFVQYLSRVYSLTIIFCCWYTTETAGISYVYCGMADKIAMILTYVGFIFLPVGENWFKKLKCRGFFYQYSISKLLQKESQNAESRRVPQELSSLYFMWRSCIYWLHQDQLNIVFGS